MSYVKLKICDVLDFTTPIGVVSSGFASSGPALSAFPPPSPFLPILHQGNCRISWLAPLRGGPISRPAAGILRAPGKALLIGERRRLSLYCPARAHVPLITDAYLAPSPVLRHSRHNEQSRNPGNRSTANLLRPCSGERSTPFGPRRHKRNRSG